jgi:hypothetical protein
VSANKTLLKNKESENESIDDEGNKMTLEETTHPASTESRYSTSDVEMDEMVSAIATNSVSLNIKDGKVAGLKTVIGSPRVQDGGFSCTQIVSDEGTSVDEMEVETTIETHHDDNNAAPSIRNDDPAMDGTFRVLQI